MLNSYIRSASSALKAIRAKANPGAKIVLLGYPFIAGDTHYSLTFRQGGKTKVLKVGKLLHTIGVGADSLDQSVVNALNAASPGRPFAFVSVHKLFDGPPYHGLYANKINPYRWMIQPSIDADIAMRNVWYHPDRTGCREEAKVRRGGNLYRLIGSRAGTRGRRVT